MDRLIQAFTRVQRGLADAQELSNTAACLEDGSLSKDSVSDSIRLGILDFPDEEQQQMNIATATSISKADLLKRAVESACNITQPELNILKQRYWLDSTEAEDSERSGAQSELLAVSRGHWAKAVKQLKRVRSHFYDPNEEQALACAEVTESQRDREARKQREWEKVEANLDRAQPWVRKMWQEDQGERKWGFAAFSDPCCDEGVEAFGTSEYGSRHDMALWWARDAVGCHGRIGQQWQIQHLDWPIEEAEDGSGEGEDAGEVGETKYVPHASEDEAGQDDDKKAVEQLSDFEFKLTLLRERFRAIRSQAPDASGSGLRAGILCNVFLVVTQACVDSVLGSVDGFGAGLVDNMWVWAVDPDFESLSSGAASMAGYKGYLRVRVQQLVNNFYEARRFHEDEYSMERLWEAAQKSKNQAFTSLKDVEARMWSASRDVGTALRVPGTEKVITNLDNL